eukprot:312966-Rhodomonas_salina.1
MPGHSDSDHGSIWKDDPRATLRDQQATARGQGSRARGRSTSMAPSLVHSRGEQQQRLEARSRNRPCIAEGRDKAQKHQTARSVADFICTQPLTKTPRPTRQAACPPAPTPVRTAMTTTPADTRPSDTAGPPQSGNLRGLKA